MRAVILAGGKGTRLHPYTASFPKPLMPVGDTPIMERLLRQLRAAGIRDVTVLTGHLAYLIEGYFGDGAALDVTISYLREERPLGTAGPLRQLADRLDGEDFLVLNGGLLTDLDFAALATHHHTRTAAVTVGTYRTVERVDLGVLHLDAYGQLVRYDEKPSYDLDVSMGVYVMSPDVLARIPAGPYDMPALIADLIASGVPVHSYPHHGLWLDIGRPEDYSRANTMYRSLSEPNP